MSPMRATAHLVGLWFCLSLGALVHGGETTVRTTQELRRAAQAARPGDVIRIAPGDYAGGIYLSNLAGREGQPVVIRGADPARPPTFAGGGSEGWHLSDCKHLTLGDIVVKGYSGNGINIDDGGSFDTPAHHIVLENVTVLETGPRGNHDALKMSGVDQFAVRNCRFEAWGGSAIDMVGCHKGVVDSCRFVGRQGFSQDNGVQTKGGTTGILIQGCTFERAGQRAINLGGSTGLAFFRPKAEDFEARDITVAGNRFVGGMAHVAFVTSQGGHVHHNTFYLPEKWLLRILQEMPAPFKPAAGGVFEKNLIVYDRRMNPTVNVGPRTAPQTFTFRSNAWFATHGARPPGLPVAESGGLYQVDPKLTRPGTSEMKAASDDPRLKDIGADAYKPAAPEAP
ncbi:MAG: hypothetical protein BWX88_01350 [Planctomycetes bacterium ADurb.Bin126]|nr:MAG: hypothetical protein BWX88_01350 [Planctomycetes bacterium ADurb.Bin126]